MAGAGLSMVEAGINMASVGEVAVTAGSVAQIVEAGGSLTAETTIGIGAAPLEAVAVNLATDLNESATLGRGLVGQEGHNALGGAIRDLAAEPPVGEDFDGGDILPSPEVKAFMGWSRTRAQEGARIGDTPRVEATPGPDSRSTPLPIRSEGIAATSSETQPANDELLQSLLAKEPGVTPEAPPAAPGQTPEAAPRQPTDPEVKISTTHIGLTEEQATQFKESQAAMKAHTATPEQRNQYNELATKMQDANKIEEIQAKIDQGKPLSGEEDRMYAKQIAPEGHTPEQTQTPEAKDAKQEFADMKAAREEIDRKEAEEEITPEQAKQEREAIDKSYDAKLKELIGKTERTPYEEEVAKLAKEMYANKAELDKAAQEAEALKAEMPRLEQELKTLQKEAAKINAVNKDGKDEQNRKERAEIAQKIGAHATNMAYVEQMSLEKSRASKNSYIKFVDVNNQLQRLTGIRGFIAYAARAVFKSVVKQTTKQKISLRAKQIAQSGGYNFNLNQQLLGVSPDSPVSAA